jgi:hypothetical protein
MKGKHKNLERFLNSWGKSVVKSAKANLKSAGKGGGKLENSIKYKIVRKKGVPLMTQFLMANYGTFVDKGVKGAGGEIAGKTYGGRRHYKTWQGKREDSPYKYGTGTGAKGGLRKGISSFIQKKKIKGRDRKTGRFITNKSLKFLISRSIWIKGIHGISFFQKAFGIGMKKYSSGLAKAIAKDIADNMNNNKNKK